MHKLPRTSVKAVGASQGPGPNAAINMSRRGKATRPIKVRPPGRPCRGTVAGRRRRDCPAMTSALPVPSAHDEGPGSVDDLAGSLRTEVSRLAYHLRIPATKSGITPTRLAALAALARHDEGCRQGDLAVEMGVSPASMTRLVEIMVTAKWVLRQRDPSDARAFVLRLSGHGRRTLEGLRSEGTSRLSLDIKELTDDERQILAAAIPILRGIADRRLGNESANR
jgi:DNA-binding MarR family transcriptional regulator